MIPLIWKNSVSNGAAQKIEPLIGNKAYGLARLPRAWVPPFFALTKRVHDEWLACNVNRTDFLKSWAAKKLRHDLKLSLDEISDGSNQVIIRSSAFGEDLRLKGRFVSDQTIPDVDAVLSAAVRIWTMIQSRQGGADVSVPLVVQRYVHGCLIGHLSNERRVSKNKQTWLYEGESVDHSKHPVARRQSVKPNANPPSRRKALYCEARELEHTIRSIAGGVSVDGHRSHYEWIWDGKRLWLLQEDREYPIQAIAPGADWKVTDEPPPIPEVKTLAIAPQTKFEWPKAESLRIFRKCGLPTATIYVLENPRILRALASGQVPRNLQQDLEKLLHRPLLIRTDSKPKDLRRGEFVVLAPHSDTLDKIEDVIEFLTLRSREFLENGLHATEFCFLIHNFIAATAGAFCLARPDNPKVRIDASWGVPNTLLFFPHDSFEVDEDNAIAKRFRCKTHYVDVLPDGKWVEKKCGEPWDWKASLTDEQVRCIATYGRKVAQEKREPVEIMIFVGVDPGSGHPNCLPWVIQVPETGTTGQDRVEFGYSGLPFEVGDIVDVEAVPDLYAKTPSTAKCYIHLRPRPELIRSSEFIDKVATIAKQLDLPVRLEGSMLSHIYYLLIQKGVRVQCVDPFDREPRAKLFGKLVRDGVPDKIRQHGESVTTRQLSSDELLRHLQTKAVEEALEFCAEDDPSTQFEEMADILEVLYASCRLLGREFGELQKLADAKREKRGGFEHGLFLLKTKEQPLLPHEFVGGDLLSHQMDAAMKPLRNETGVQALKLSSVPKMRGDEIITPLAPPVTPTKNRRFVLSRPETNEEIILTYSGKNLLIRIAAKMEEESIDQLKLAFEEMM